MKLNSFEAALALALALHLAATSAFAGDPLPNFASPAIGTLSSRGAFRLNHATLLSNATLFEGAIVETGAATSQMELASGTRMALEAASQAKVFGDHIVLESGAGRVEKSYAFRVEARGLTIRPDSSASAGRVQLVGARRVQVAALSGSFRVLNLQGMVVAKISSGKALVLEQQSPAVSSKVTGVILSRSGHYVLTDETTNVTVELMGAPRPPPAEPAFREKPWQRKQAAA